MTVPLKYLSNFWTNFLMAELFMINLLATNSKNMMKLERLQHDKDMIIQQDVCWIINNLKTITN